MHRIEFNLIKTEPITFKVCGVTEDPHVTTDPPPLPAYLQKDMIVTLASGKWPLVDYRDCNVHKFVFQKEDGSQFTLLLCGFTCYCTESMEKQQELLGTDGLLSISLEEVT